MNNEISYNENELKGQKLNAEIAKLMAETGKIQKETFFYPVIVLVTLFGAALALVTAMTKVLA